MPRTTDKDVQTLFEALAAACGRGTETGEVGAWQLRAVARGWIIEEFVPLAKDPGAVRSTAVTDPLGSRVRGTSEMMSAMYLALAAVGSLGREARPEHAVKGKVCSRQPCPLRHLHDERKAASRG